MKNSAEVRIGIGLPTTVPGATGELLLEWARRADAGPFSSVGVLDRVVYDSYEPFAALAGAAAVTSRVRLATMIAIGPLRSTAMLAKQAASVHGLSGGRLTLGLAVGARTEDFDAAGVEHRGRGKRLGEQLAYIRGDDERCSWRLSMTAIGIEPVDSYEKLLDRIAQEFEPGVVG